MYTPDQRTTLDSAGGWASTPNGSYCSVCLLRPVIVVFNESVNLCTIRGAGVWSQSPAENPTPDAPERASAATYGGPGSCRGGFPAISGPMQKVSANPYSNPTTFLPLFAFSPNSAPRRQGRAERARVVLGSSKRRARVLNWRVRPLCKKCRQTPTCIDHPPSPRPYLVRPTALSPPHHRTKSRARGARAVLADPNGLWW